MQDGNVFISYRREDSSGYARSLYDRLNSRFPNRVFMDVSRLDPGVDFIDEIQAAVGSCKVLVVLIGKYWAVTVDGKRRLFEPDDFVKLEVAHALERKVRVIPVLVGDARMPGGDTLPPELAKLTRRQALKLEDETFDYNATQLLQVVEKELGESSAQVSRPSGATVAAVPLDHRPVHTPAPGGGSRKWRWVAAGAGGILLILVIAKFSGVLPTSRNPADQLPPIVTEPPPVDGSAGSGEAPAPDAPSFNPVGKWRITRESTRATLFATFTEDRFEVHDSADGRSTGTWSYEPPERTLTLTGLSESGLGLPDTYTDVRVFGDHFEGLGQGVGTVVFTSEE